MYFQPGLKCFGGVIIGQICVCGRWWVQCWYLLFLS